MKDNAQRLAIRRSLVNRGRGLLSLVPAIVLLAASTSAHAQTFAKVPALSFVKHFAGPNPLPQTIAVASTGANFNFNVSVSTSSGGNWLVLAGLGCGETCGTTPRATTVSVNPAASLAPGSYTGQMVFTAGSQQMITPVTLLIQAAGTVHLEDVPGALNFSFETSGVSPPSQAFEIHAVGAGSLGWSLSTSTADGHNWLSVPLKSGVTPSTITANILVAALPGAGRTAGTFIGQIALVTATGNVTVPVTVTVGDSVFQQINPISFSKPFGGANPLPQVLTVASTGAAINFSASLSTGSGGDWLSVAGLGCGDTCGNTPRAITVSVTPGASLAAGIYTGEITISSGSMAMSVPVTLTIVPNAQPSLDNLPGQISFSLVAGGVVPPIQPIQIRNAGLGTLGWTVTDTTADGGLWLTTSAASGTAPSTVTVGINPTALPNQGLVAGTFTGRLVISTAAGVVTIPVSVTVGDSGNSVFEQANAINFVKPFGGANPLPQVLTIGSSGAPIPFSAGLSTGKGGDWLSVTGLGCGDTCGTTPRVITASVNPIASLAAGTYTGEINITSNDGGMTMTIPVSLTIVSAQQPFFDNLPGQLSFSFKTGTAAPPNQSFQIRNAGSGVLNWTASKSTSDGGAWLNVSPGNGTAPGSVSVGINISALPNHGLVAGTFTGQIVVSAPSGTATIPVTVTAGDSVFEQINPMSFVKVFGSANPLPQVLTIASTGDPISFSASWSTANGGNWLSVTGLGCGDTCGTTARVITVSVNPIASLVAGTYTGEIIIVSGDGALPLTIPIALTITASGPTFDNLPGEISFSLLTGGANPPAQSLPIRNVGAGTLSWTAAESTSDGGAWLSVTPSSGTTPASVTVAINKNALPNQGLVAGTFTGHVVLIAGSEAVSIPVSVIVDTTIFHQPPPIVFTKTPGGANPVAQTSTIASFGNAVPFSAAWFTGNGGNWLSVSGLGCGDTCGTTPQVITVSANTSSLGNGSYTGEIIFISNDGAMSMTVPVYLTIGNPSPTATTTSLTSSANPSQSGQTVTFTATVSGSSTNINGSVVFKDGSSTLATVSLTNRVATFATSALALGSHSISAVYSGDSNNFGSSAQITQTVQGPTGKPVPTATLTSSLGPTSIAGAPITFVAQVTHSGVTPTGTVTFKDGNTVLGTVSLVNGTAPYATATLSAGLVHTITAVYNGDGNYAGSTAVLAQRVIYSIAVSLQSSADPSPFGHFVTITATLSSAGPGIAGYITFFDGGTPITAVYVSGNTRPLTLSNLSRGTHSITAAYGGDYYHGGAFSPALIQVVN